MASMINVPGPDKSRSLILAGICLSVLCGIVIAGLWPFHSPKNDVTWLKIENGLRFGDHGTVLSSGRVKIGSSEGKASCSVEIWVQPALTDNSNTFLAFYTPRSPLQFSLHQSDADLVLQRNIANHQRQNRSARFYVDDVFREGKPVFITITSSPRETAVYIDGTLTIASRSFPLSTGDLTGQLVVGDSPLGPDSWSGKLLGLAIYNRELTAQQVSQNYKNWTTKGGPDVAPTEGDIALYLFDEQTGMVVHNQVSSGVDLQIPERYLIVDQVVLQLPWKEFYLGWSYWKDVFINIGGFIPFGFFLCFYLSLARNIERAALVTIILGSALSLTIEILQAYLPTRQSGMTDVITNTLGTCIGVAMVRCKVTQALYRANLNLLPFAKAHGSRGFGSGASTRIMTVTREAVHGVKRTQ